MAYMEDVKAVATAHADQLRGDLDHARSRLRQARAGAAEMERQVAALEALLALAEEPENDTPSGPRALTLHEAMAEVLKDEPGEMLRANDLAMEINRRQLYRMRDGRPVEGQQVHARVGHYGHLFTREGTFIKLVATE